MRSLRRVALLIACTAKVRMIMQYDKGCDDIPGSEQLAMLTGIAGSKRLYVAAEFEVDGIKN